MENPLPTEARDIFLAHFPERKRGTIANWFLEPIRGQRTQNPQIIITCVLDMLYRRLESAWASEQSLADASAAIECMQEHRDEALAFAVYYIAYVRLPDAERESLKEHERAKHKTAYMAAQPPTDRQLGYLRTLGYLGEPPASMHEASEMIDRLVSTQKKAVRR